MRTLNGRQAEIVRRFLNGERSSARELASSTCVSERTIRTDLTKISSFLDGYGARLCDGSHGELSIIATPEQRESMLASLSASRPIGYQIVLVAALRLLIHGSVTYKSLTDECHVSRQTLIRLFSSVEHELVQRGVEVARKRGKGILVRGAEVDVRRAFVELLAKREVSTRLVDRLFSHDDEAYISASLLVSKVSEELGVCYYDAERLAVGIAFCLRRQALGCTLDLSALPGQVREVRRSENFELYDRALDGFRLPIPDKLFLTWILMGATVRKLEDRMESSDAAFEMASFLLEGLQRLRPLSEEDRRIFLKGLEAHLSVAIYRARNRMTVKNLMLDQVKLSIPLVFEFTKEQMTRCAERYGVVFDEDEMAFVAMYAASAYETSAMPDNRVTVLLVCSFGTTTGAILSSRMRQLVPECRFLGPLTRREARAYVKENPVDLVVCTGDHEFGDIRTIQVSPLLQQRDVDSLKSTLYQLVYEKLCKGFLSDHMRATETDKVGVRLGELIRSEDIQVTDAACSWERAIEQASDPLLRDGRIERRYIRRMISAVKEFGTYMVMTPGTAYVHAGSEDGINQDCTALLVMRGPIPFGDDNVKMVRNIVVLGLRDEGSGSLLSLAHIFARESNQQVLASPEVNVDAILDLS